MSMIQVSSFEEAAFRIHLGGPFKYGHPKPEKPDYVVISITDEVDPNNLPVVFRPVGHLKAVLHLSFVDLPPSKVDPSIPAREQYGLDCPAFSEEIADRIIDFADQAKEKGYNILVHCEAGVSRSQAIGAFLEVYLNKDASHLEDRLHAGNLEYFQLCWQTLWYRGGNIVTLDGYRQLMTYQEPIYQEPAYTNDSPFDFHNIVLNEQGKHDLKVGQAGPHYPKRRMDTLYNRRMIRWLKEAYSLIETY